MVRHPDLRPPPKTTRGRVRKRRPRTYKATAREKSVSIVLPPPLVYCPSGVRSQADQWTITSTEVTSTKGPPLKHGLAVVFAYRTRRAEKSRLVLERGIMMGTVVGHGQAVVTVCGLSFEPPEGEQCEQGEAATFGRRNMRRRRRAPPSGEEEMEGWRRSIVEAVVSGAHRPFGDRSRMCLRPRRGSWVTPEA